MAKRIFEFRCVKDHVSEKYVDDSVTVIQCPHCGNDASRIISTPHFMLEGYSGSFPTASAQWVRKRESHIKYERKMNS